MVEISIIPRQEFDRIWNAPLPLKDRLSLVADMCRANALSSVKKAGSGHLGSTFSSLDIVTMLYYSEMNTVSLGKDNPDRDIYFSSKGHDVPGYYAVLYSLGLLPEGQFIHLRRIVGTCGHPDVGTPCVEANSGSLGMGISKAKGMAFAKHYNKNKGRIFVMTGDGELQEGQNYEALLTAVHQKLTNITVIVDHNKVQTDKPVSTICDLGDLESKFLAFGWHVARCDGHDFAELERIFHSFDRITDKPKVLIADTVKGKGISFMEHPVALAKGKGFYQWHSGAPDDVSFQRGFTEITDRINQLLFKSKLSALTLKPVHQEEKSYGNVSNEFIAEAYGNALLEIAQKRKDVIVLDADLAADCRIRNFESALPEQFIENGIAEQDMVSMAGGLALHGLLPVVNSFAVFLASRANEQIYNNNCEKTKIIYACHYAGLIPAGPGQSHQSIRDISLFGALPQVEILQPCNAAEMRLVVNYCINEAESSCMIRIIIGPSPRIISLPIGYTLKKGTGFAIREGTDAVLFAYGPVMLHEALIAAEHLEREKFSLKVVNMPWLNMVDVSWLKSVIDEIKTVLILEDHAPFGGLSDTLIRHAISSGLSNGRQFEVLGIEGSPAWGRPWEVLKYHGVDGVSLANRIKKLSGRMG
jgi:transketolase